jgi:quinol monooxygenase YgiN
MICRIVEYVVQPDALEPVITAIADFLAAIERMEPATRYEAFQRPDRFSFIHFMIFADEAAEQRHREASYTQRFVAELYPNCEVVPVFTDVRSVRVATE